MRIERDALISDPHAAAVGCDVPTCAKLLDCLVERHLLYVTGHDSTVDAMDTRYGFPSLIKLYDRERLNSDSSPPRPSAAVRTTSR